MKGKSLPEKTKEKMRKAAIQVAADPEERKRRSERAKAQWAVGNIGRKSKRARLQDGRMKRTYQGV